MTGDSEEDSRISIDKVTEHEFILIKKFMNKHPEWSTLRQEIPEEFGGGVISEVSIRPGYDKKKREIRFFAIDAGNCIPLEESEEYAMSFTKYDIDAVIERLKKYLADVRNSQNYEF